MPISACSWNVQHSGEEQNLRHDNELEGLLELELHDRRHVTHRSPGQYFYTALALGGSTGRKSCRYATSRPPPDQRPGTTHGHQRPIRETPGPCAAAPPPPLRLHQPARSRRRRVRARPPAVLPSAAQGELRAAGWRRGVILGASITCSGTTVSSGRSTSTSWSTVCGTRASRICTMGTSSAGCSTVRRWIRSCGPGGSAKLAGLLPPGSSSYKLKSSVWGGGGFCRRGASYSSCLLPGPGHLRSPRGGKVRHLGQGHLDGHPLMSQP